MRWVRRWKLELPGLRAGAVGYDPRTDSVLVADGWGVAYAALRVRRVERPTGRVAATIRTQTPIRAFGVAPDGAVFLLGEKKIFVLDATTLELRSVSDQRVPRYSNEIAAIDDRTVALAAPSALVEYDLDTAKTRRIVPLRPAALASGGDAVVAILADGTVRRRHRSKWELVGSLGGPQFTGGVDTERGLAVALGGERTPAYDSEGKPQAVSWPQSRSLTLAELSGPWLPRVVSLASEAMTVGIVRGDVVAVDASRRDVTRLTVVSRDGSGPRPVETLPEGFVAFVGSHGFVASPLSAGESGVELSLFEPADAQAV